MRENHSPVFRALIMGVLLLSGWMEAPAKDISSPASPSPGHIATKSEIAPQKEKDETRALAILFQIVERLGDYVQTKSLSAIHDDDLLLNAAVNTLKADTRNNVVAEELLALTRAVGALHAAGDAFDQTRAEAELAKVRNAWSEVLKSFDPTQLDAARILAERYCCPMHPDVIGKKSAPCPKCGMPLDSQVRPSLSPVGAREGATIKASVLVGGPLRAGEKANARLRLTTLAGKPVLFDQLREVHTRRIHLLLIDGSLTDYHHEHPLPTGVPGEFAFSFTPLEPGPYRVWADVQPYVTGLQEYATAVIPSDEPSKPFTDKTERLTNTVNGLRYALEFGSKLVAGRPLAGKLKVTRPDGSGFPYLEPVMGAFVHLVAFHEDGATVVHFHSTETRVLKPNDRGGPEFKFQFFAPKPGFYRLFVQVQFNRVQEFVPFGIRVAQ